MPRKTKTTLQHAFGAIAIAVGALFGGAACAGTITIGFEDGPYGDTSSPFGGWSDTNNFISRGFVFSPGCHFDNPSQYSGENGMTSAPFGRWLGFDTSGCYDGSPIGYNTNYLGPGGPVVRTSTMFVQQEFGAAFSLHSFVFATVEFNSGGLQVRSSNGGLLTVGHPDGAFATHTLSSPEWTDIRWLEFTSFAPGAPVGFDELVVSSNAIPEPNSLLLLFAACGLAAFSRRKSAVGN